jgi:hypothetical protein
MTTVRMLCIVGTMLAAWLLTPRGIAAAAESEAAAEANRIAHDHVLCRKYGYEEGSDEFAHCLEVLAQRRLDAKNDDAAKRREASTRQRALSNAEKSGCDSRDQAVSGGGRGPANAHEGGIGTCSH